MGFSLLVQFGHIFERLSQISCLKVSVTPQVSQHVTHSPPKSPALLGGLGESLTKLREGLILLDSLERFVFAKMLLFLPFALQHCQKICISGEGNCLLRSPGVCVRFITAVSTPWMRQKADCQGLA